MTTTWQDFLAARQTALARPLDGLRQARDGVVLCDLGDYALLAFDGADAEGFLHGQLSSDVHGLTGDRCQLSTYNSAKGRVLATLLVWRSETGFLIQLPTTIAESVRRRLAMYILRAKVTASSASERLVRLGVGGPSARKLLRDAGIGAAGTDLALLRQQSVTAGENHPRIDYTLQLSDDRHELVFADVASAIAVWRRLEERGATPAAPGAWRWLTLRSGIAEIEAETQDQFVAQMLNFELLGGISFKKGCYPGQEIVARTQYRGEIKRRTLLGHTDGAQAPAPGTAIVVDASPGQAVGTVVNAVASPGGGCDLLACLHVGLASGQGLRLRGPAGPRLELVPLPYAIPAPSPCA